VRSTLRHYTKSIRVEGSNLQHRGLRNPSCKSIREIPARVRHNMNPMQSRDRNFLCLMHTLHHSKQHLDTLANQSEQRNNHLRFRRRILKSNRNSLCQPGPAVHSLNPNLNHSRTGHCDKLRCNNERLHILSCVPNKARARLYISATGCAAPQSDLYAISIPTQ
jgi:hypothetical protein